MRQKPNRNTGGLSAIRVLTRTPENSTADRKILFSDLGPWSGGVRLMKKSRFDEHAEVCRKAGISEVSFYSAPEIRASERSG